MANKKILPPLHLATSDDELRPALMHIEIKKGIATATNAHIIAQLNLAEYSDLTEECIKKLNGKLIHRDIWLSIIDAEVIEVTDDTLHYEKGGVRADVDISCTYKFPNHKAIIDAVANSIFDKKSFIAFNPEYIAIAKKIFPSENLIMRFYENNEMMLLFPSGDAKGFVGIMPLKITEEEAVIDFTLS
jgi:hypothetical protein